MALLILSLSPLAIGAAALATRSYSISIERQPLPAALRSLTRALGLQFASFANVDLQDIDVGPVVGRFTREAALEQLLSGSRWTYRFVDDHTVAIIVRDSELAAQSTSLAAARLAHPGDSAAPDKRDSVESISAGARALDPTGVRRKSLLARIGLILSGCLAGASGPACAQDAGLSPTGTLQDVVVTGIRASMDAAIAAKRDSDDIVETVSAEDIGKLPDTNIAESLARLPGVTVQRSGANDSAISIRGFGPDFNGTLLNGREQVSTGDNRAVEFDQYPAELASAIVVYKSGDAALVGQGLAGTIDIRTTRPLEYGHRAFVLDARAIQTSNGSLGGGVTNRQYRASISYVDQFLDNQLGVTIGLARLNTPAQTTLSQAFGPWQPNTCPGYPCFSGVANGVGVTSGNSATAITGIDKRDGALATLEWKPSASYSSTLDLYYTDRIFDSQQGGLASLFTYNGYLNPPPVTFSNTSIVGSSLVGATVSNLVPIVLMTNDTIRDRISAAGWNNKWTVGAWTMTSDLSYSRAIRDEHSLLTYGGYQGGAGGAYDTETFSLPAGGAPTFHYGSPYDDPSQVKVGSALFGGGYAAFPHIEDELKSVRFDIAHPAGGWFSEILAGINYSDRTKDKRQPEAGLSAINYTAVQLPSQYLLAPTNLGFAGAPSILNWKVPEVLATFYQPYTPSSTAASYLVGKSWGVEEKLTTLYVKGNLSRDVSEDVRLRGNVGLQVVRAQQSSTANYWNATLNNGAGGAAPIGGGTSYSDALPSANFVFEFPRQQTVRVGLARESARPRMDQMADTFQYSLSQTTGLPSAVGGNPQLAPWRAAALDVSYERYFDNNAYLSATAFYKRLSSYIYQLAVP